MGAALGVLLVLFCATTVAVLMSRAGHRRGVLVVARTVRLGDTLTRADLKEAAVAADPSVHVIPAADLDRVLGRTAAVTLIRGTLLTSAELTSGPAVPTGSSVVGLDVKLGFAPAGLRAGSPVRLVLTPPAVAAATTAAPGTPQVLAESARVFDVTPRPDGQGQLVSVVVDDVLAPPVAAAGARGEVSVVLVGGPA